MCETCRKIDEAIKSPENSTNTVYISHYFLILLNERWSPHTYRSAILSIRHIGVQGQYGNEGLEEKESQELKLLRISMTDTLIELAKKNNLNLMKRNGFPLIDCLTRPATHTDLDLLPSYEGQIRVHNSIFPQYLNAGLDPGKIELEARTMWPEPFSAKPIVCTLQGTTLGDAVVMPEELRKQLVNDIKSMFLQNLKRYKSKND